MASSFITPRPLSKNAAIAMLSPAGIVDKEKILTASQVLNKKGYKPIVGQHAFYREGPFAGSDKERLSDLTDALNDPQIEAIFFNRGGYGCIRLVEELLALDFDNCSKWIVGYSDITVLHSLFSKKEILSIHGTMPGSYLSEGNTISFESLFGILNGKNPEYSITGHKLNRKGEGSGQLTGGNLSVLYSLQGTELEMNTDNKILFIEDIGEYLYHLDRIMLNLKLSGKLSNLKGLIVGWMTNMKDGNSPFGNTEQQIIMNAVKEYNYPVIFDFPAGHEEPNMALVIGAETTIEVTDSHSYLRQKIY